MDYIIDPMAFYWISVFDTLHFTSAVLCAMFVLFGIILVISSIADEEPKLAKVGFILFAVGVFFFSAAVFFPSKEMGYQMLIAKIATRENINWTVEQVKEVIDYIISAAKGV